MDKSLEVINKKVELLTQRHHIKLESLRKQWLHSNFQDIFEIKEWIYDFSLFLTYHFYTEEYFMSVSNDQDKEHIQQHRYLVSNLLDLLINVSDISLLKEKIDDIMNHYILEHLNKMDITINYDIDYKKLNYFINSDYCGIILLQFNGGIISVFYGELSGAVLKRYFDILGELIPSFSPEWKKIVDLSRWDLTTFDAIDVAIERNRVQHEAGCSQVLYVTQDDDVSKYVADKILREFDHISACYSSEALMSSDIIQRIVHSGLVNFQVVATQYFIMNYYDEHYPDV